LKQNPDTAAVPVLLYTGRTGQIDRLVGLKLGAEDYIEKPFDAAHLVDKIRRSIEKARERATQE
jgi:DNA-binding response OmpR family regulator